jgi:hypothetical protein
MWGIMGLAKAVPQGVLCYHLRRLTGHAFRIGHIGWAHIKGDGMCNWIVHWPEGPIAMAFPFNGHNFGFRPKDKLRTLLVTRWCNRILCIFNGSFVAPG